ncbi:MAG: hypothetical protein L6Q98_00520 [Anaerolineae bacterium]|nr:hypothetical protein [Anaerolineae bacterium]NUQ04908.1 tetratricopeptide repeat protein [Anaerolineae bacterium]
MAWMKRINDMFSAPVGSPFDGALAEARRVRCGGDAAGALERIQYAENLASYGEQTTDVAFERGRILIDLRRLDEAQDVFDRMQRGASGGRAKALAQIGLGELAAARGDQDAARTAFEAAVSLTRGGSSIGFSDVAALSRGLLADAALRDGGGRYADHLLREALSMLPIEADRGLRGWLTGLQGEAALENGQIAQGMTLLDQAMALSVAAGCRVDSRRWAARMGERALAEGRVEDAHAAFTRVLSLYPAEAAGGDFCDALVGMSRAALALRDAQQHEEALRYAEKGLKIAESLQDSRRIGRAHGVVGEALKALGRSEEALPHLRAVLTGAADAPLSARRALGGALFAAGEHAAALTTYEDAITRADHHGSPLERADLRRDLGLARWRLRDYSGAIQAWTTAAPLYEEANSLAQSARIYVDIANARRCLGARSRAVKDIEHALMQLNAVEREDVETRGVVLANAAMIYAEGADAESADSFFKEAIELAASAGDRAAQATRLGNYGWFLLLVGRPRRAQTTLEQALAISQELGLKLQEAVETDNLGLVHDALGEYPRALDLHQRAETLASEPEWTAVFRVNAANTLTALGRADEALSLVDQALAAGGSDETRIAALIAQARARLAAGSLEGVDSTLDDAVAHARRLDHRRLLAEALAERSRLQSRQGDHEAAGASWSEAQKLYLLLHMPQGKLSPDWL